MLPEINILKQYCKQTAFTRTYININPLISSKELLLKSDNCCELVSDVICKYTPFLLWTFLFLFLLINCAKKETDYIWNPESNPPEVNIEPQGFEDKEIINTDNVVLEWEGNSPISEFSYKLNDGSWSAWSDEKFKVDFILDDGDYVFVVRTRYKEQKTIKTDTVFFTVDAVDLPGIAIYPQIQTIKDKSAIVSLRPEGLENCKLLHVEFEMSGYSIETSDTVNTALISENVIDFIAGPQQFLFEDNKNLKFTVIKGKQDTAFLKINQCIARDSSNTEIELKTVRGGMVIYK